MIAQCSTCSQQEHFQFDIIFALLVVSEVSSHSPRHNNVRLTTINCFLNGDIICLLEYLLGMAILESFSTQKLIEINSKTVTKVSMVSSHIAYKIHFVNASVTDEYK